MQTLNIPSSKLTTHQKKVYGWKLYKEDGQTYRIKAIVRHDDECGNEHNSFSITGQIDEKKKNSLWYEVAGGCLHDEIAKHFPELAPFIKWHLMGTDQPLHYIDNTLYHAGTKDCHGKEKGEPYNFKKSIRFFLFPVAFNQFSEDFIDWAWKQKPGTFKVCEVAHINRPGDSYQFKSKYTFHGIANGWHDCPFDTKDEAEQFATAFNNLHFEVLATPQSWGEGKEPDLKAARASAIWPEASLEQLNNKEALEARLLPLMQEFKKDVESLGLVY